MTDPHKAALAALTRAIANLEAIGSADLIPDVDTLCDLSDRLVLLAQDCSSRTADIRAAARQRAIEAAGGITTLDVRDTLEGCPGLGSIRARNRGSGKCAP